MAETFYDPWADYYDAIHTGLPGEAEFYVGQAVRMQAKTLELGCGTGRIAIPMAMSGVDVVGLDNSKAMLRICREKKRRVGATSGDLRIVEADMREFDLKQLFDLAVLPYRALMHLLTPECRSSCLTCIYRHLRPGGQLILNTWRPRDCDLAAHRMRVQGALVFAGKYPLPGTQLDVAHYVSACFDEENQILDEQHVLHELDPGGEVLHSAILPMRRAWVTPLQMQQLLESHNFVTEAVFGDFDCAPFTTDSTEMIWIAGKQGSNFAG